MQFRKCDLGRTLLVMSMDPHNWAPLSVDEAVQLFTGAPFRWWISGGHALEIHANDSWRPHDDLDIGIIRDQAPLVHAWLTGWDLHIAARRQVSDWNGRPLSADRQENNVWARRSPQAPWSFDLTVGAGADDRWVYRRDPTLFRPWDRAILRSPTGVPYLAPEIQLLFKSKSVFPKDDLDAERIIPGLGSRERRFLVDHLSPEHQWRRLLKPTE
jgi:hypothetical protein